MESPESAPETQSKSSKDSLGLDLKKSPWFLFALLQIPIVIGMIIFIFILYQKSQNS